MTTVNTTNVSPGTQLYFSILGFGANQEGINQADFSTPLEANVMINSDGKGSHLNTVIRDELTEGDESFVLKLYTDLDRANLVAISEPVTINDTSTTPVPTYSIVSSPQAINEGGTLKTSVSTKNVASGTLLYWAISGSKVNKEDFSSGSLSGSCTVDKSGNCFISHSLAQDKLTEGDESFAFNLFSDDKGNTPLASSSSITIHDTSIAPPPPTY